MRRWATIALGALSLFACEQSLAPPADGGADTSTSDAGPQTATWSIGPLDGEADALVIDEVVSMASGDDAVFVIDTIPNRALVSVEVAGPPDVEAQLEGFEPTDRVDGAFWWRSWPVGSTELELSLATQEGGDVRVRVTARMPPPEALRDRSLVWTDVALVDAPEVVGLGRVMRAAAGAHGGTLLDDWLRTFARTAHSERPALADFADHLRALHGEDPALWALDALPFRVTAVHNRIDLRNDTHCGELRVSFTVTDPAYPFIHFLFLFAQTPADGDISVTGTLHCEERASRWAGLSSATADAFAEGARDILDEALVPEAFLLAESLERTVGTWEWRQWNRGEDGWSNPPLFQTVDAARLNAPGPDRDALLSWIESEADDIASRRALIPSHFAPASARATEGIPRDILSVEGIDGSLDADAIGAALDTMGCPGCHARSPTFLQTNADRSFSPFYADELVARGIALDSFWTGAPLIAPFGSLSDSLEETSSVSRP